MKAFLPFWALPLGGVAARTVFGVVCRGHAGAGLGVRAKPSKAAAKREPPREYFIVVPFFMFLCRLRDGIEQCRLALLDHGERTLDGRAHLTGIFDWPFGVPSHGLRELGEINRRVVDLRRDRRRADVAVFPAGASLDLHKLGVVRTVVVH